MRRHIPLLLSLALAAAPLASARTPAIEALSNISTSKTPCTALEVTYEEADALGGGLSISVSNGRVSVVQSRIGLPDLKKAGVLQASECKRFAAQVIKQELWTVKAPKNRGLDAEWRPTLRVGVKGAGSFVITLAKKDVARIKPFADARAQILAVADRVTNPARAASVPPPGRSSAPAPPR